MSTVFPPLSTGTVGAVPFTKIVVQGHFDVPTWVNDLDRFRAWVRADNFACDGWVSFLNGEIWVDLSMEELITHNQVKSAYAYAVMNILTSWPQGMFVGDRMLLTNVGANLSTEPDGLFVLWETYRSGRLTMIAGADGFTELSGTPDMALEVVSKNSVRKDTVDLRDLYHKAGIAEYWLVDARGVEPQFEILRHTPTGYVAVEPVDGWLTSSVLQRQFRLVKQTIRSDKRNLW